MLKYLNNYELNIFFNRFFLMNQFYIKIIYELMVFNNGSCWTE